MKRIKRGAIVVLATLAFAAAACGQPLTTAEQTQTAQAVVSPVVTTTATPAMTTTPGPTTAPGTATAQPTPPSPPQVPDGSPRPIPTAVDVSSTPAAAVGRTDCPADWSGHVSSSGRISVCFPPDWHATIRAASNGYPEAFTVSNPASGVLIGIEVVASAPVVSDLCGKLSKAIGIPFSEESINLLGGKAQACQGHGDAGDGGVDPTYAFAQVATDTFLQFEVSRNKPDSETGVDVGAILATVKVH